MKKKIIAFMLIVMMMAGMAGCASWQRFKKDVKSDLGNGLYRTVTVYTADGKILREFEGKIDFETTEGGIIKFDYKGKRYMYYNCFVESIEK